MEVNQRARCARTSAWGTWVATLCGTDMSQASKAAQARKEWRCGPFRAPRVERQVSAPPAPPVVLDVIESGAKDGAMKKAIRFSEFTPVPVAYASGALLPDKASATGLCKRINALGSGSRWKVEEVKVNGKSYWKIVSET